METRNWKIGSSNMVVETSAAVRAFYRRVRVSRGEVDVTVPVDFDDRTGDFTIFHFFFSDCAVVSFFALL
jgi:hypothetical protein